MSADRDAPDKRPEVVVIGASAGGIEALSTVAEGLPEGFGAAVFVVLHLREGANSVLPEILDRAGPLAASVAVEGASIVPGTISVAPADHHLLLEHDRMRVLRGPKVNGNRPSVDVLFHSAARAHGSKVIGVVLSGALADGTLGLRAIKRRGGVAIVQSDAPHLGMPTSAVSNVEVDATLRAREIAHELTMHVHGGEEEFTPEDETIPETELEAGFDIAQAREAPDNGPTPLRCPECGGALWELEDGDAQSYACHVGHTYSTDSMLDEQGKSIERALWTAVRMLEERVEFLGRLAGRVGERSAISFQRKARAAEEQANLIREALLQSPTDDAATQPPDTP